MVILRSTIVRTFWLGMSVSIGLLLGASVDARSQGIQFPHGFTRASGLTLNGSAVIHDGAIRLTNGKPFEAGSVFSTSRLPVAAFTTDFEFKLTDAAADGFAFVLEGNGPDAIGSTGGNLGYGHPSGAAGSSIPNSLAVAFDLHNNQGEGSNSVRLQYGGVTTGGGPGTLTSGTAAVDLTRYGLDLHSGHPFHATITYSESNPVFITLALTDLETKAHQVLLLATPEEMTQFGTQYVGIPLPVFLSGSEAYVGFTGATGEETAVETIDNWTFTPMDYTPVTLPIYQPYTRPTYPEGFAGVTSLQMQLNGGAAIEGSALHLTRGKKFTATSAYFVPQVQPHQLRTPSDNYFIDFDFVVENGEGDGFTFVLQDENLTAVGPDGGGLGYGPSYYVNPFVDGSLCDAPPATQCPGGGIGNSLAIKFDLHNNAGEGPDSTGIYFNGESPTIGTNTVNLEGTGIRLHSGHPFHVKIQPGSSNYAVQMTLTDLATYRVYNHEWLVGAPPLSGVPTFAYAGFTAGTGATPSSIKILNFTWTLQ